MQKKSEDLLASYVDALHSIIYINHFDFNVVDNALRNIGQDAYITEYNNALGEVNFKTRMHAGQFSEKPPRGRLRSEYVFCSQGYSS